MHAQRREHIRSQQTLLLSTGSHDSVALGAIGVQHLSSRPAIVNAAFALQVSAHLRQHVRQEAGCIMQGVGMGAC